MSKYRLERTAADGTIQEAEVRVFTHRDNLGRQQFKMTAVEAGLPPMDGEAVGRPFAIFELSRQMIARMEERGFTVVERNEGWWPEEDEGSDFVDVMLALPENGQEVLVDCNGSLIDLAIYRDGRFNLLGWPGHQTPVSRWAPAVRHPELADLK